MSKVLEEFSRVFERRLNSSQTSSSYARVTRVNESLRTCVVEIESIPYENVLLYSVEKESLKGLVCIPAINSIVIVSRIEKNRLFVEMFSDVDKVLITVADTAIQVSQEVCEIKLKDTLLKATPDGLTLKRGNSGLKKTLEALIDAIIKITVPTAVGPSGTPVNTPDFVKVKTELAKYLEE